MLEMNFPCHNLTLVMHIIYEPKHCAEFRLFECLSELTEFAIVSLQINAFCHYLSLRVFPTLSRLSYRNIEKQIQVPSDLMLDQTRLYSCL